MLYSVNDVTPPLIDVYYADDPKQKPIRFVQWVDDETGEGEQLVTTHNTPESTLEAMRKQGLSVPAYDSPATVVRKPDGQLATRLLKGLAVRKVVR